jgi:hypothetical protein
MPTPKNIKTHTQYRNKLNKMIKVAKKTHLAEQLEKTKRNPKQQAKILKTMIPSKSKPRTSPTTITYENKTHTNPTHIANAFNDFFITIGHKTSQKIPQQQNDNTPIAQPKQKHPEFKLQHTTIEKVTKIMKQLNPNKAQDIYKIKPAILKDLTPFLAPILTSLFNKTIDEHKYPDSLKVTKVIEIYKAKDKTLPTNYRPISLLPIIAKLLDKIINDQIMTHLIKHNIISPTQYAFRPHSSTTTALQTIINNIHSHKTKRKPTLAIYVDLSKAYDTISHRKLTHKLRHDFNFTPQTVQFFKSYLQNRTQSTHTQHAQSETRIITHGIPQGSTLSTTFFLLYINDIILTVPQSKVYTYADDTTLIITSPNIEELQKLAQSELTNLIRYFHVNNLVPNPTKTVYSIFHPQKLNNLPININDNTLQHTAQAKLLGITIQDNLKHHTTITKIIKKLQPTIRNFTYANKFLPTHKMRELYFTHAYPHLIGAITIWGTENDKKTYIQPLIRTQKKLIRLIKNLPPRTHTKPLMTELKILKLTNLYILRVCVEMHPFIHPPTLTNRPEHIHNYLWTAQIHDYPTRYSRQKHHFIPNPYKYSKTKQPKYTMNYLTRQYTKIWNTLPLEIRNTSTLTTFTKLLKTYLLHQQQTSATQWNGTKTTSRQTTCATGRNKTKKERK